VTVSLLLVGGTTAVTADRLDAFDDAFATSEASLSDALERLARERAVDCVLVGPGVTSREEALLELARAAPSVPRLVVDDGEVDVPAMVAAGATDVAPLLQPTVFARRVCNAVFRRQGEQPPSDTRTKIRRLHEVATDLDSTETEAEIFELAVAAAEDILDFDICYIGVVEEGEIRPQAANHGPLVSDPVIMSVEEGVAGRTVRERRTFLVDDAAADPDADPVDDSYRSSLSIPVADWGVFQAVATEVAAFTEQDRKLGELLVSHMASDVERVRYEAQLRHERDRFRALFDNVPDAVVRTRFVDGEPVVRDVNAAFERIFGYDVDDVVGESLDDVVVPPEEAESARRINEAVRDGQNLGRKVTRQTADGQRTFLLRSASVEAGDEWAIYTDIEDLKRREAELQRQNERLASFAGMVSHDLRNPLNVATGNVEAAIGGMDGDHLSAALAALARMDDLIEDLLTLARKGEVVDEPEPTDVGEVARRAWWGTDAEDATLSVESPPTVQADPDRLRELFENLFRNAVVHGGEDVAVTVDTLDGGGFFVEDDGPGIPPDEREAVLEPGFTTRTDGTGLGLAIVEEVAAAHGWGAVVTEGRDGGARFEFALGSD
jgi:PAS domain S-box-containing protein